MAMILFLSLFYSWVLSLLQISKCNIYNKCDSVKLKKFNVFKFTTYTKVLTKHF